MCDLEANKREMFDGMRAYHRSEISHANSALTMLLAVASGAGAVVIALLFPDKTPKNVIEISWGMFVFTFFFSMIISMSAHIKISSDHEIYKNYGKEYVKTCILLGYYDKDVFYEIDHENSKKQTINEKLKTCKTIGQGNGYRVTQLIIWLFTVVLNLSTLTFALLF